MGEPLRSRIPYQDNKTALKHIDMNLHHGGHPRIGAVDVIPFTPQRYHYERVSTWHTLLVSAILKIQVFLFTFTKMRQRCLQEKLEVVRKGQYEVLKDEAKNNPDRYPDIGGPGLHPQLEERQWEQENSCCLYVNLKTEDVEIAKKIANTVRASSGGFCHVKGIGLALEERELHKSV